MPLLRHPALQGMHANELREFIPLNDCKVVSHYLAEVCKTAAHYGLKHGCFNQHRPHKVAKQVVDSLDERFRTGLKHSESATFEIERNSATIDEIVASQQYGNGLTVKVFYGRGRPKFELPIGWYQDGAGMAKDYDGASVRISMPQGLVRVQVHDAVLGPKSRERKAATITEQVFLANKLMQMYDGIYG
ncbi:hypothetical protein HY642_05300 [Candidatus Woesearchaeota archaeon]|nr:hypothetical protein [Candidatus Woesearchaeota archaeon]